MVVGLFDGTNYGGLNNAQNLGLIGSAAMYGSTFPNTLSGLSMPTTGLGIGVTTDPSKSGLVAVLGDFVSLPTLDIGVYIIKY